MPERRKARSGEAGGNVNVGEHQRAAMPTIACGANVTLGDVDGGRTFG